MGQPTTWKLRPQAVAQLAYPIGPSAPTIPDRVEEDDVADGRARVAIIMGSKNDWDDHAARPRKLSRSSGIACDVRVISAHRTPERA